VHQQEIVHTMKTAAGTTGTPRRQQEKSFKAELVEQCLAPGASVAAVALAGGINANLLFSWRRDHLRSKRLSSAAVDANRKLTHLRL
jgi:transposase